MTRTTTLWSLLLLSAALALGSCTKDATEQATGPEPEAKAASKLVFSSENAVRGELLVCFGEEAVAGIESSVMQVTRSGGVATRSGIAPYIFAAKPPPSFLIPNSSFLIIFLGMAASPFLCRR